MHWSCASVGRNSRALGARQGSDQVATRRRTPRPSRTAGIPRSSARRTGASQPHQEQQPPVRHDPCSEGTGDGHRSHHDQPSAEEDRHGDDSRCGSYCGEAAGAQSWMLLLNGVLSVAGDALRGCARQRIDEVRQCARGSEHGDPPGEACVVTADVIRLGRDGLPCQTPAMLRHSCGRMTVALVSRTAYPEGCCLSGLVRHSMCLLF